MAEAYELANPGRVLIRWRSVASYALGGPALSVEVPASALVADSSDAFIVGVPQNKPVFWDGTRYWVFYQEAAALKCLFGTALDALTDAGATGISSLGNTGKMYSVVFGQVAGTWYAWVLYHVNTDPRWRARRWTLGAGGLASAVSFTVGLSSKEPGHVTLQANYGSGDITELLGAINGPTSEANPAYRSMPPDLSTSTGMNAWNPAAIVFPEHAFPAKLTNGYLSVCIDEGNTGEINGDFGHVREARKTAVGDAWGAEVVVEGNVTGASAGAGDFTDQNYASNTSHAGQQDFAQTDDGKVWCAYIRNDDLTAGDFGRIALVERGNAQASGWTLRSSDVIGTAGKAWHLAITTDGTDIWIFYCRDVSGVRDTTIRARRYRVAAGAWTSEVTVAAIAAGHALERMASTRRTYGGKIPVVWSEKSGSTYDLRVAVVVAP